MWKEYTNSLSAWAVFMLGMEYYRKYTKEDNALARELFEAAIKLDPNFVRAHANLAATYRQDWTFVWTDNPANLDNIKRDALTNAENAVNLAREKEERKPSLPYALQQLAYVHMYSGKLQDAMDEATEALNFNSQYADGHAALAQMLIYNGQPQQALARMEIAKSLNPKPPAYYHYHIGQAYYVLGVQEGNPMQFVTAIGHLQRALEISKNFRPARAYLVAVYSELGLDHEAQTEMRRLQDMGRDSKLFEEVQRVAPYGDQHQRITDRLLAVWRKAGG